MFYIGSSVAGREQHSQCWFQTANGSFIGRVNHSGPVYIHH